MGVENSHKNYHSTKSAGMHPSGAAVSGQGLALENDDDSSQASGDDSKSAASDNDMIDKGSKDGIFQELQMNTTTSQGKSNKKRSKS